MGFMTEALKILIDDCAAAGIVFHPSNGKLNPERTRPNVGDDLLSRIKTCKEELLDFFDTAFGWTHEHDVCVFDDQCLPPA